MPGPFPGMDPYLEDPELWRPFHGSYVYLLQEALNGTLPDGFFARMEARVYVARASNQPVAGDVGVFATAPRNREGDGGRGKARTALLEASSGLWVAPEVVPGEEVTEYFVEVVDGRREPEEVVTVIELLSPANKKPHSDGRRQYLKKQQEVQEAGIHLLELDLLRGGAHTVGVPEEIVRGAGDFDYLARLHYASSPHDATFWRISLRKPLPTLPLPLTDDMMPVRLELQSAFDRYYDNNRLERNIKYTADPVPPLDPDDAAWTDALLREKGLR